MSYLAHMLDCVEKKGSHSEAWIVLSPAYFSGPSRLEMFEEWATKNGLHVDYETEAIRGESFIKKVHFRKKKTTVPN
jgi:hypothetical protein